MNGQPIHVSQCKDVGMSLLVRHCPKKTWSFNCSAWPSTSCYHTQGCRVLLDKELCDKQSALKRR